MAYTKCNKTLETERLYCRQATVTYKDPSHHDFESKFDLTAAVQRIAELRAH